MVHRLLTDFIERLVHPSQATLLLVDVPAGAVELTVETSPFSMCQVAVALHPLFTLFDSRLLRLQAPRLTRGHGPGLLESPSSKGDLAHHH